MIIKWTRKASEDIKYWKRTDNNKIKRIKTLIEAIEKDPFTGIGKPEALKYDFSGCWSRRITIEHRLVYKVIEVEGTLEVHILQARFHY